MRLKILSWRLLAAFTLTLPVASMASPVGDAIHRPSLQISQPARAVLLSVARAGQRFVAVGERGVVTFSDDGGANWSQAPSPVSVTLTKVAFADERNGVAVGHGGVVLVTSDAGASWVVRLDGRKLAQIALQTAATDLEKQDAERLVSDGPDKPFLDIVLWDSQEMLAVGAYGLAFHSRDGGVSWQSWMNRIPNPKALHWYVARREGQTVLLAGEQGLLATSSDAGVTFRSMDSPYRGSWFAGELKAGGQMLLAGMRGNLWRSKDAGTSWTQFSVPSKASIFATTKLQGGGVLLANQSGLVSIQQDENVRVIEGNPLPPVADIQRLSNGDVLTVGTGGVAVLQVKAASDKGRP